MQSGFNYSFWSSEKYWGDGYGVDIWGRVGGRGEKDDFVVIAFVCPASSKKETMLIVDTNNPDQELLSLVTQCAIGQAPTGVLADWLEERREVFRDTWTAHEEFGTHAKASFDNEEEWLTYFGLVLMVLRDLGDAITLPKRKRRKLQIPEPL